MAHTLEDKMRECLKQSPGQKFTPRDLAILISKAYPDWFQEKAKRSTGAREPLEQVVAEVGALRERLTDSNIKTTNSIKHQTFEYYY